MKLQNIPKRLVGNDEERAVSPVIGVILMVAITVILAAVIAAFVLDLGDTSEPAQASFDIHQEADGVDQLNVTVQNADRIDALEIRGDCADAELADSGLNDDFDKEVGESFDVTSDNDDLSDDCEDGDDIAFVAIYDGNEEIVNTHTYADD